MYVLNIGTIEGILPENVTRLSGGDMATAMTSLTDAWLCVDSDGTIAGFGPMSALDVSSLQGHELIDAGGGMVIPAFCDSHTHIIYAGSRELEFEDKIRGLSYEEIARRGGGILNSADRLAAESEDRLLESALRRARDMMSKGTGAMEVKSGYGLSTESELKMLRVAARLADAVPARVVSTFLGAHAVPASYCGRQGEYVDYLITEMLPAVAAEGLAGYVDVFCDRGFFTVEETSRILEAASRYGMKPTIHANELDCSGGVQVGLAYDAVSVDHLERMGDEEIEALRGSETIATMLPGASFFLGMPYAPARRAVDAGLTVALASDYNPGSSPSGDMRMVMALGCIKMKLTPMESLAATTINGAAAMELSDVTGSISIGRDASFIITRPVSRLSYIPYAYTEPFIHKVVIRGHMTD